MRKNRVGVEAVEARSVDAIRDGKGWQYSDEAAKPHMEEHGKQ
jgi:hypothetical protein